MYHLKNLFIFQKLRCQSLFCFRLTINLKLFACVQTKTINILNDHFCFCQHGMAILIPSFKIDHLMTKVHGRTFVRKVCLRFNLPHTLSSLANTNRAQLSPFLLFHTKKCKNVNCLKTLA